MILSLQRFYMTPKVTLGVMIVNGIPEYFTVERPWKANIPHVSCIPPASYPVKWVMTETAGNQNGRGLGVENVPGRSLIRIHVANKPTEVEGCIGIGMRRWDYPGGRGVGGSSTALKDLFRKMKDETEAILRVYNPVHIGG